MESFLGCRTPVFPLCKVSWFVWSTVGYNSCVALVSRQGGRVYLSLARGFSSALELVPFHEPNFRVLRGT